MNMITPELFMPQPPGASPLRMLYTNQEGFVPLISVLVIGAIGLEIATSLLLLGLGAVRSSAALEVGLQARSLADACATEGLRQVREAVACSGSGVLTLASGDCNFTTSLISPTDCQIEAQGTAQSSVRYVEIHLTQVDPDPVLASWREVTNN